MENLKFLFNRLKCYINNIGRYEVVDRIELKTGIVCVHILDNWRKTIKVTIDDKTTA